MGAHVQPVLLLRRGLLVLVAAACVHPGSAEAAAEEGPPEGLRLASAAEARCAASVAGGLHIPPGPDCDACASGSPNLIMEVLSDGGVYNRCLGCCVGLAASRRACCGGTCCDEPSEQSGPPFFRALQAAGNATNATATGIGHCETGCIQGLGISWALTSTLLTYALCAQVFMMVFAAFVDFVAGECRKRAGAAEGVTVAAVEHFSIEMSFSTKMSVHGGVVRDIYIVVASMITCVLFAFCTYWRGVDHWVPPVEMILSGLFVVDYAVFFIYEDKASYFKFVLQVGRIIDVITIVSAFFSVDLLLWNLDDDHPTGHTGTWLGLTWMRMYHVVWATFSLLQRTQVPEIYARLIRASITFMAMVYMFACSMYTMETLGEMPVIEYYSHDSNTDDYDWSFFQAVYFTMVTISTVGYGDYSPTTVIGRSMIMVYIICGVAFFTSVIDDVLGLLSHLRAGRGSYALKDSVPHVVIVGDLSPATLLAFFDEFFNDDHQTSYPAGFNSNTNVVILSTKEKNEKFMRDMQLRHPREVFRGRVQYFEGSALNETDLQRAKVDQAVACFIMSARITDDEMMEDAGTVLRVKAVLRHHSPDGVFVTLCQSMNKEHVINAGVYSYNVVCMREFRLAGLAKSCECKGFATLIGNIVTTRSNNDEVLKMALAEKANGNPQLVEFVDGSSHGLNRMPISAAEDIAKPGRTFGAINIDLYKQGLEKLNSQSCLIAVVVKDEKGNAQLKMNPGSDYVIPDSCVAGVCLTASNPNKSLSSRTNRVILSTLHGKTFSRPPTQFAAVDISELDDDMSASALPPPTRKDLDNHILVCGCPPVGIHNFVRPLREDPKWASTPIVFFNQTNVAPSSYRRLVSLGLEWNVFFLEGNPNNTTEFALARVQCTVRVVILTPSGNSFEQEPQLADSLPLTLATWLTTNYPHLFIVTETANESCIKYIDERSDDHTDSVDTTSPAMEEALFYSSKLVAAGRITSVSSIVSMLVSSYYLSLTQRIDPNVTVAAWSITTVIERLVSGVTNTVRQVVIEPQFVGKTYLALFEHYTAKENAVPLGLYRRWDTKEHEDEEAGFVMSNPKPDVVLREDDLLFVLMDKKSATNNAQTPRDIVINAAASGAKSASAVPKEMDPPLSDRTVEMDKQLVAIGMAPLNLPNVPAEAAP